MNSLRTTVVIGIFVLLFHACDLFQTRDPEQPSQKTSTFIPPTKYEYVLSNLQFAIAEDNVDNYMRCFADTSSQSYEFIPAQETRARYPTVFNQWNLESERQYFQNLGLPVNGAPLLTFSNQSPIYVSTDSVVYNSDYLLYFPHRRVGVPQVVQGNMQLYLGADLQQRWSIYRWRDSRTTTDSTWSYLKAIFSGG